VLFWANILSRRSPTIELKLGTRPVMTIEKQPVSGLANFAITMDPATYEEEEDSGQADFWSLLSTEADDEGPEEAEDEFEN
jgi:hypothetical protein